MMVKFLGILKYESDRMEMRKLLMMHNTNKNTTVAGVIRSYFNNLHI